MLSNKQAKTSSFLATNLLGHYVDREILALSQFSDLQPLFFFLTLMKFTLIFVNFR